jgi:anti-repressor protein
MINTLQENKNITLFGLFGYSMYLCKNLKHKDMLKINENNKIDAREIYKLVEVKTIFWNWLRRCIDYADMKEGVDFITVLEESTGGRQATRYEFTISAAKEMCIVSATSKAKELRRWLIELSNKRENLELITVKEAAFAVKVINCMKYIENQKEAYTLHKNHFVAKNIDIMNPKFIYSEFAKYRTSITGWTKDQINEAINKYISEHSGYDRKKINKANMSTKLSIMDVGEAIRVAVLDILYSKETDSGLANRFSKLCKEMAKEMGAIADKENKPNLFRDKEDIDNVKMLTEGIKTKRIH